MTTKKLPTIYQIKRATLTTNPYYFTRDTMRSFGQTLKDFRVSWANKEKGIVCLWAKTKCNGAYSERWYIIGGKELYLSCESAMCEVDNATT